MLYSFALLICLADVPSRSSCFSSRSAFGRLVMGLSWERIGADYNVLNGGLMPFGLLVMLFSPMITEKLRAKR